MKKYIFLLPLLALLAVASCKKDEVLSNSTGPKNLDYDYIEDDVKDFTGANFIQVSDAQIALGRTLFYDDVLSVNGRKSCGSCHLQSKGFADGEVLSNGFLDKKTKRHSMSLVNTGAGSSFFWDGRAHNLNKQVLMPIRDHIEMGSDNEIALLSLIQAQSYYKSLFIDAFGSEEISTERVGVALAGFVKSLVSYNTKFDRVQDGIEQFTSSEEKGKQLFETTYRCSSCHGGENFNSQWGGTDFANIGLSAEIDESFVSGRVKVPSLRNVMVTAPYMHDGSKGTIDEVLNHYSQGIQDNELLDWRLRDETGSAINLNITAQDKKDIISFLHTLTDQKLLTDAKYSDPF